MRAGWDGEREEDAARKEMMAHVGEEEEEIAHEREELHARPGNQARGRLGAQDRWMKLSPLNAGVVRLPRCWKQSS